MTRYIIIAVQMFLVAPLLFAEVTKRVAVRPTRIGDAVIVDLTHVAGTECTVIDPFFAAPGLETVELRLETADGSGIRRLTVPKREDPGQSYVGSIVLPQGCEVGGRFVLTIHEPTTPSKTDLQDVYLRLLGQPQVRDETSKSPTIEGNRVHVGKFHSGTSFGLRRLDEIPQEILPYPVEPVCVELGIADDRIRVCSVNHAKESLALLDPFLIRLDATPFAGRLWIDTPTERRDILDRPRLFPRPIGGRTVVPSGGITIGWVPLAKRFREVEFDAVLEVNPSYANGVEFGITILDNTIIADKVTHLPQ